MLKGYLPQFLVRVNKVTYWLTPAILSLRGGDLMGGDGKNPTIGLDVHPVAIFDSSQETFLKQI